MNGLFSTDFRRLWQLGHAGVMKMFPRSKILFAAALSFAALSIPAAKAESTLRTYFNPAVFGKPVIFCMSDRASCGKLSADAWCHENGYTEALTFERLRTADKSNVFRQIKCINREQAVAATDSTPEKATP
jgi:Na+-transporting NADH:ubiquinone oxidoreductase subunit NqrB